MEVEVVCNVIPRLMVSRVEVHKKIHIALVVTPTSDLAISVRDLTKRFGSFTAVDHITFSVRSGEIFGFLGANGAGKTTAMRMLCGLSLPTEGSGTVAGCDVANTLAQSSPAPLPSAQAMQSVDYRYNPTLNFRNYMIPALIIVLLIIICGFLPALNLVGEKESGTIEAINVTPVGRFTFVLSKLIPFWLVGIFVITVGMLIGYLVYGLAPLGSIAAIYAAAIIFSLFMSGLAVAIANSSESMLQCIFIMFACIMIFQLMGGLFTPISSMPEWAQTITYLIPPRYFNEIIRALYLKGSTIAELLVPFCGLSLAALLTCSLAALTYRKRY